MKLTREWLETEEFSNEVEPEIESKEQKET